MLRLKVGEEHDRDSILRRLEIQYTRNDMELHPRHVPVRGDTLEIFPVYARVGRRDRTPVSPSPTARR